MEVKYKYNKDNEVIIELCTDESSMIIRKNDLVWKIINERDFNIEDSCFVEIESEEAQKILKEWGLYK